jgi:hypothetical protein
VRGEAIHRVLDAPYLQIIIHIRPATIEMAGPGTL